METKRERSAAYPSITLEDAVKFTQTIAKNFPSPQELTRDDIATVLKKKTASVVREVATCSHFGLLERTKNGYKISSLFKAINHPVSKDEERKSLVEAFRTPKLYNELIEKYDNHAVPSDLKPLLIRFHGISEKVAAEAADIFFSSGIYCGAINGNILNTNLSDLKIVDNDKFEDAEVIDIEDKSHQKFLPPVKKEGQEQLPIRLTGLGRYAFLTYPSEINEKDIEILKKQIEVLELIL
ncbi:MAG: hypothetical protein K8H85_04520 [Cyclobacteriaceae bacterium]|nr:hypothetical protein [Cyclobacteriaceae bacterium]